MQILTEILLSNAVIATLLAVIAMAVGRYCRRPTVMYGLWLLVLLKLVTPPLLCIRIPFSTHEATPELALEATSSAAEPFAPLTANSSTGVDSSLTTNLPESSDVLHTRRAERNPDHAFSTTVGQTTVESLVSADRAATGESNDPVIASSRRREGRGIASKASIPVSHSFTWRGLMLSVWIAGSIVWLSVTLLRLARFCREIRRPWPMDENLQRQADNLARRFGLPCSPAVKLVDVPVPPMLWAMRRPAMIILPRALLARLSPQQQSTLLAHELAHYYRRDHWVRWLEVLILGVYWWHPIAWLARRELQRAEEQCCDAWVLWALPDAGSAYARAILETVDFLTADYRPSPVLASGLGPVHLLERRFEMILHARPTRRLNVFVKWAFVVLGLIILPLSARGQVAADAVPPVQKTKIPEGATATVSQEFALEIDTEPAAGAVGPVVGSNNGQPVAARPDVPAATSSATSGTIAQNDSERRLDRLEKMMGSIQAELKNLRTWKRDAGRSGPGGTSESQPRLPQNGFEPGGRSLGESDPFAPARGAVTSGSVRNVFGYSKAVSLSDLKKQRIDVEDELENLKDRLAKIDEQIAKLQSARSPTTTNIGQPQVK